MCFAGFDLGVNSIFALMGDLIPSLLLSTVPLSIYGFALLISEQDTATEICASVNNKHHFRGSSSPNYDPLSAARTFLGSLAFSLVLCISLVIVSQGPILR
jgi:hypothetical protein